MGNLERPGQLCRDEITLGEFIDKLFWQYCVVFSETLCLQMASCIVMIYGGK